VQVGIIKISRNAFHLKVLPLNDQLVGALAKILTCFVTLRKG
jgi:hypothetical protein